MEFEEVMETTNKVMLGFDALLASGTLLAPTATLRLLGHEDPSPDATELFRRCAPVWFTFVAAHAVAARRGSDRDWWALAWLRGTELATDVLWSRSASFTRPGARVGLWLAGAANAAMAFGFARRSRR